MRDLREAKKILGIEIHKNRREGTLFQSQKKHIEKVSESFGMLETKSVKSPLAAYFRLLQSSPRRLWRRSSMFLIFSIRVQLGVSCMLQCALVTPELLNPNLRY